MEIKPHTSKSPMEQMSQEKLENTLNWLKMKMQQIKILWDAAKALLRGIFIALDAYRSKEELSQINKLNFHIK